MRGIRDGLAVALAVGLMLAASAGKAQTTTPEHTVTIKILLVNGKNGKLIKNAKADIWIGKALPNTIHKWKSGAYVGGETMPGLNPVHSRPDGSFLITGDPPPGGWIDVIGIPPFRAYQCEPHVYPIGPLLGLAYPIADVVAHGVVSDNICGKAHAVPKPGTLVIFMRPMTFWEELGS